MSEAQTDAYVYGAAIEDVLRLSDASCLTGLKFVSSPPLVHLHAWFPEDEFSRLLLTLSETWPVWESGYYSKGIDYAYDRLYLLGEIVYSEGYGPECSLRVFWRGD